MNVSLFHNKLKDMQIAAPVLADASSHIFNVGRATIDGVEVESLISPFDDLTLGLNYAYLHAKIDKFPVPANTLYDPEDYDDTVLKLARRRSNNIAIANTDSGGDAWVHFAIDQAERAVKELVG